jgi:hypothetical protein
MELFHMKVTAIPRENANDVVILPVLHNVATLRSSTPLGSAKLDTIRILWHTKVSMHLINFEQNAFSSVRSKKNLIV